MGFRVQGLGFRVQGLGPLNPKLEPLTLNRWEFPGSSKS